MAYERAADIVRLALRLQGTWRGLTLDDIQRDFEVARRTAERLRNAVEDVFGPLELVDTGERRHHWRLRTSTLRSLVTVSAEELAELNAAAAALDRTGVDERATMLRQLADKLRALLEQDALTHIEPGLQALMVAEGLAMRPGPRPRLDPGLLGLLRDAIKTGQVVAFDYRARATGNVNRREVQPYGIIYGNRAFLVGHEAATCTCGGWPTSAAPASPASRLPAIRRSICRSSPSAHSAPTRKSRWPCNCASTHR